MDDEDRELDAAISAGRKTPDEVNDALRDLIGLVQQIVSRGEVPPEIVSATLADPRYLEARAVAKAYL